MDLIENRYKMIIESERSGRTISGICTAFGVSRQTWYKWKRRYNVYGIYLEPIPKFDRIIALFSFC
jgi:transposase-like protein